MRLLRTPDARSIRRVGVKQPRAQLKALGLDLLALLLGDLASVCHDQGSDIVAQATFSPCLAQILHGAEECRVEKVESPCSCRKSVAARESNLILICVVFHSAGQQTTDRVADHHEYPQDAADKPDHETGKPDRQPDGRTLALRKNQQAFVPGIAFGDNPPKPIVDSTDQTEQSHCAALREVPEFVGQHPSELTCILANHQRQTEREDQAPAEKAAEAVIETGRCVWLAIDHNPTRHGSVHGFTHTLHKCEQKGFLGPIDLDTAKLQSALGREWFEHENHQYDTCQNRDNKERGEIDPGEGVVRCEDH
ncbi:hypothetical protein AMJ85_00775 [candidate division BRC1 bacterium SM23_51]|nr:MAG: hypothetical protein AMJ85_00775 [candidate division BRC1 bacterium SM23_51]